METKAEIENRIDRIAEAVNGVFKAAGENVSIMTDAFTGEREIFFPNAKIFLDLADGEEIEYEEPVFPDDAKREWRDLRYAWFYRQNVRFKTLVHAEDVE